MFYIYLPVELVLFCLLQIFTYIYLFIYLCKVLQDGTVELYLSKEDKQSEGSANIYKPLGKGKVFRITNPYYPQDKQSRKAAVDRALRKVGQQGYSASSLNCQHFVAEILTGRRYCMDLEVKSQRIVIAFLLDSAGFVALQLVVKKLLGLLPKAIYVCVKGIFSKDAWTNGMLGWGSDGWRGFCSKGHTAVAHLKHAGASVGIGVGISILLEALMLVGQTIYEYKQYKEGKLDAKDFAKSFTKNLASSSGSVLGTFIGTLVGCGIPVPGMMFVGAMVGGFLGRFIGYAIAHYRTERSDSDTWLIKKITKKLEQKSLCQKAE